MLGKIQIPSLIRQQHSCKPIVFSARDFFVFGKIQKGHLNDFLCRINIIPDLLFVGFIFYDIHVYSETNHSDKLYCTENTNNLS